MRKEKIVLSFIAVVIGLLVAGIAFYLYQTTKTLPSSKTKTVSIQTPTPTPKPSIFLVVDSPKDEEVVDTKTVRVSGKTTPDALVVISTQSTDEVVKPATNGNYSTSINIQDGQNQVEITAIALNGEEAKITKTVTYSTESF